MSKIAATLAELEKQEWGNPPVNAAPHVRKCYELRHKQIDKLSTEDYRMLIGQEIGLEYLLPKAIDLLMKDPLQRGMHYPGDLLCAVLRVSAGFYLVHQDLRQRIGQIVEKVSDAMKLLDPIDLETAEEAISEALDQFRQSGN